jgi:hypothetical protein
MLEIGASVQFTRRVRALRPAVPAPRGARLRYNSSESFTIPDQSALPDTTRDALCGPSNYRFEVKASDARFEAAAARPRH